MTPFFTFSLLVQAGGARALSTFGDSIKNTTIDRLIEICGKEDIQDISVIMRALEKRIDKLVVAVTKALETLSCANLVPIYVRRCKRMPCLS